MVLFPIVFLWIGVLVWASWRKPVEDETPPDQLGGGPRFRRRPPGPDVDAAGDRRGRRARQRMRQRRSARVRQPR